MLPEDRIQRRELANSIQSCLDRLPEEIGWHLLHAPTEPHFVHLSWAVRRLTPTQARYIKLFYGGDVVRQLEAMERKNGGTLPPEAQAIVDRISRSGGGNWIEPSRSSVNNSFHRTKSMSH